MLNKKIRTGFTNENKDRIESDLVEESIRPLNRGEILVEVLLVPMHGSFWLASHPEILHPRKDEFLANGSFVFGNGGVGRVVQSSAETSEIEVGDYVCIFGHVPCNHYDCYACRVLHRYTECDYGESSIIGHGKNSYDGTFANYVILPRYSYDICFGKNENPTEEQLTAFMFGFLVADVRNALTRHADSLRMRRMLLIGAGYSGMIAAYLHNKSCPESKIFVIDSSLSNLEKIRNLSKGYIETYHLSEEIVVELNNNEQTIGFRNRLKKITEEISMKMKNFFGGYACNLLFDSSSGNTAPLWDNNLILRPTTHVIPFGFGSHYILLNKELIQMSGLNILMSRGVGNIRNRKEVIELIKAGMSNFINAYLVIGSKKLISMEKTIEFIKSVQNPAKKLHEIQHAYFLPNPDKI